MSYRNILCKGIKKEKTEEKQQKKPINLGINIETIAVSIGFEIIFLNIYIFLNLK